MIIISYRNYNIIIINDNIIVSKTTRASGIMHDTAFIEFDIWHRMAFIAKFILGDLDLRLQGQIFQMLISRKW